MNLFEIEKEYLEKKLNGMDFDTIRKELLDKGLDNQQTTVIIRSIDNKILKGAHRKMGNSKGNEMIYIGLALFMGGLIVTIGTYMGYIDMGDRFLIMYGPIFSGIAIIAMGLTKRK